MSAGLSFCNNNEYVKAVKNIEKENIEGIEKKKKIILSLLMGACNCYCSECEIRSKKYYNPTLNTRVYNASYGYEDMTKDAINRKKSAR